MAWFIYKKTFRKHRKLIFPHRDFIICIVSLAIFHPHFVIRTLSIRIFPSAFYHPQFSIRILSSAFFYPPSAIRHPPPSGPHFTETPLFGHILFWLVWYDIIMQLFPPTGALIILWWIHALSKIIFLVTTSALGGINNRGNFVIKAYDNIKGKWFRSNVVFK